jgi:hypothetical protein
MNKKLYAAFILGLAAGSLNALFSIVAVLGGGLPEAAIPLIIHILIGSIGIINFIGACICRLRHIAGGVIMTVTAMAVLICVVLSITGPNGAALLKLIPEVITAIIVVQLVSLTASIICFSPAGSKQSDYYFERLADAQDLSAPMREDERTRDIVNDLYRQQAGNEPRGKKK